MSKSQFRVKGFNASRLVWVGVVVVLVLAVLTVPSGQFSSSLLSSPCGGVQVLVNSDFDGESGWRRTDWRSAGGVASSSFWVEVDSGVQMGVSGHDLSFYAVGESQGDGPKGLWSRVPYGGLDVSVNGSFCNVVTWRGSIDKAEVDAGCLGVGVNAWFDVQLVNGSVVPLEIFVFVYQDGLYELPVGGFKDYGYRGQFYEAVLDVGGASMPWRYFYYHIAQVPVVQEGEVSFELNDCLQVIREQAGEPYYSGEFVLVRMDAVMELFNAEGKFTIDYLGLTQSPKT